MNTELFFPAPQELPAVIRPPRGSKETLKALERYDWNSAGQTQLADLLRAGALWLHGFLDESHAIVQGISSAEGSYWHALMHRSEGDFSNSKYWYRRVGRHSIFPDLRAAALRLQASYPSASRAQWLRSSDWDPSGFVDAIEHAAGPEADDTGLLQAIAREEYNLLMGYCLAES